MALNVGNVDAQLTGSAAAVLTGGASQEITILNATATNTDTATRTITLYRVPNGGSAASSNIIGADAFAIGAGETVVLPLAGHTIVNQQSIQALASVASVVNLSISYAYTP